MTQSTFPVADLERRFYAFVVDRAISWALYAAAAVGGWLLWGRDGIWTTVGIVAVLAVLVVLVNGAVVGASGATPGKRVAGLRVVHQGTGMPIGVPAGILRSLVVGLSALPTFGFGLAALAWTALADAGGQRRGWHDHVTQSVVVDLRPPATVSEATQEAPRHVVNLTALRLVPVPAQAPVVVERPSRPAAAVPAPSTQPVPQAPVQQAVPQAPVQQGAPQAPVQHAPLLAADPGRTVTRASHGSSLASGTPRWRVVFDTGDAFVVEGLALVGRRPEPRSGEQVRHVVPLPSSDMSLSKTHAQFGIAPDGSLVVMDRGSTNGSLLLRQGVTRELSAGKPTTLVAGDRVRFGDREMAVLRDA